MLRYQAQSPVVSKRMPGDTWLVYHASLGFFYPCMCGRTYGFDLAYDSLMLVIIDAGFYHVGV